MRLACACPGHAAPATPRTAAVLDCRNQIEAFALYMAGCLWVCKTHRASVRPPCRPACPAHTRRPCWSLAASLPASSGSSHVFHTLLAIGQPPLCRKPGHDTGGGAGPGRASGTDHPTSSPGLLSSLPPRPAGLWVQADGGVGWPLPRSGDGGIGTALSTSKDGLEGDEVSSMVRGVMLRGICGVTRTGAVRS